MPKFVVKVTGEIILVAADERIAKDTAQEFLDKAVKKVNSNAHDEIARAWLDAEVEE